jgi:DNA-binding HxlR family transcriptional regulator
VGEVFLKVHRFKDLHRNLGIASNILADRLRKLVDDGILERRPYSDTSPREEYRLTQKGIGLYEIIIALTYWGNRWCLPQPVEMEHTVERALSCSHKRKSTVPLR